MKLAIPRQGRVLSAGTAKYALCRRGRSDALCLSYDPFYFGKERIRNKIQTCPQGRVYRSPIQPYGLLVR